MAKTLIGFYTNINNVSCFMGTRPLYKEDIQNETETEYTVKSNGWFTLNKNEVFPTESASVRHYIDNHKKECDNWFPMGEMERWFQVCKGFEKNRGKLIALLKKSKEPISVQHATDVIKKHSLTHLSKRDIQNIVREMKTYQG